MYALKQTYDELPENISIPKELLNKKAELIIIVEENQPNKEKRLVDFSGLLPNFPERLPQGEFETREVL